MPDMKNVVKAIDICLGHGVCNDCPYCLSGKGYTTMNCRDYMLRDALALLKEQEKSRLEIASEMVKGSILMYQGKQIVQCKDCKWFRMPRFGEEGYCENLDLIRKTTFYCADGERK